MLYIEDDGSPMVVVRDDSVASSALYIWLGRCADREAWLEDARKLLVCSQFLASDEEMVRPTHMAERALFAAGLHTPDCGDALTVPMGAQEWMQFFCKLAEGAQEVLDDRDWRACHRNRARDVRA